LASIGIAVVQPTQHTGENPEWLIERADGALYLAKAKGTQSGESSLTRFPLPPGGCAVK
jgi:PleD family two-component response regulator